MFGFGCVLRRDCRYNILVCIPLVLRVRVVMIGWVYCTQGIVSDGVVEVCGVCVGGREGVAEGRGCCAAWVLL